MNYHTTILPTWALLLAYFCCRTTCAPAAPKVKLLSQCTNQFVQITENGIITADGMEESAAVFYTLIQDNLVSLELKDKPGKFLMLNVLTIDNINSTNSTVLLNNAPSSTEYELVVGAPTNVSHVQWEKASDSSYAPLRQTLNHNTDCFVAFKNDGSIAGPCNLSQDETATRTLIQFVGV